MILPITLTIAGAAALLNIWIAVRVGKIRLAHKVSIGDGGHQPLAARMRAHSNFVEYTPFFLILLALVEMAKGPQTWLWLLAITFILGRIVHVFGMDRTAPNKLRAAGIIITMLTLLGLAIYAITIPYLEGPSIRPVDYARPL
jgi:uncharacterized membrane protein YecN with MAPEG domain